jgi:transcription initiation factor IIE alpha subunit
MDKMWDPIPLHTAIIEILAKKENLTDAELLKELDSKYNGISARDLNRSLFKLEIRGVIRVSRLMKNKKMVELV